MSMKWDIKIGLVLLAVLVFLSLAGCSNVPVIERIEDTTKKQETVNNEDKPSIPDFNGIAEALGCVFAPQTCNK